jgi:hypothetical protein
MEGRLPLRVLFSRSELARESGQVAAVRSFREQARSYRQLYFCPLGSRFEQSE